MVAGRDDARVRQQHRHELIESAAPPLLRDLGRRVQEREAELRREEASREKPGILDKIAGMVRLKE